MLIARILEGRSVLVLHEHRFQGDYLAAVLRSAGACIALPAPDAGDAAEMLAASSPGAAVVMSSAFPDGDRLAAAAIGRALETLLLYPPRVVPHRAMPALAGLSAPYAGFQVCHALAELLAGGHGGPTPRRPRGSRRA